MTQVIVLLVLLFALASSLVDATTLQERLKCGPNDVAPTRRVNTTERLADVRTEMGVRKVAAFIVKAGDAHNSEYPSDYDRRRGFISGFSGSAGTAVITTTKAALWTDGRYFLEADEALDCNWILMKSGLDGVPTIEEWLNGEISTNAAEVGVDESLITNADFERMKEKLASLDKKLELTDVLSVDNPVDKAWTDDRPQVPQNPINPLPLKFAGKTWQDKISDLRVKMADKTNNAFVVTSLDETTWLFNLRGSDITYNPFVLSYAIVQMDEIHLYLVAKNARLDSYPVDSESENVTLASHLNTSLTGTCPPGPGFCVQVHEYIQSDVESRVTALGSAGSVWVTHLANYAIYKAAGVNRRVYKSPLALQKSIKNNQEVEGMKKCYDRDSIVLIKFLAFLEKEIKDGKKWTEVTAGKELDTRRSNTEYNRGLSFETISSFGSNGAIIHYRPAEATDKDIDTSSLYLLDSGGQYLDGTTDVTRTMHYGTPTAYEKECYTRVLASTINLAVLIWPAGLYGNQIDSFARYQLWEAGLYYLHGTGHGIGAYLSVHEGPGSIGGYASVGDSREALYAQQYYSDEPGYYEDGQFGIRLETIVKVTPHKPKYDKGVKDFLEFLTVTLVPFEPNLINYDFLTDKQIDWLNSYNALIRKDILPKLQSDALASAWVESRTQKIERSSNPGTASLVQPSVFLSLVTVTMAAILKSFA